MAENQIQQNLTPTAPQLKDLLDFFKKEVLLSLNCHHIAKIESFDADKQWASASVVYKKTVFNRDDAGNYKAQLLEYPVLLDCPVISLGGGDGVLTFPVAEGDECLALFNDRDMDNWIAGSTGAASPTPRLHSFADAILLVGLRSLANKITNYNTDAIELRTKDGLSKVSIDTTDGSVTIFAGEDTTVLLEQGGNITVTAGGDSGLAFVVDKTGKISFTNGTGEFVAALIAFLQSATAGGYPLVGNLATLQSFQV